MQNDFMKKTKRVADLYVDNEYVYQQDLAPVENYSLFIQSISFLNGVDFIESKDKKINLNYILLKSLD